MNRFATLFLLLFIPLFIASCKNEKRKTKEERIAEEQFFDQKAVKSLNEMTNEMAQAPTDFLRTFKDDPIPWQTWNHTVPEKAKSCQAPILALVVSSKHGYCRHITQQIIANDELLSDFKDNNLCTLIDIHAHPEIGMLSYHLARETRQPIGFPMLIWMSHEACPLYWLNISNVSSKKLTSVITNSSVIVNEIWHESSDYAVKNSRRDNDARQQRLDSILEPAEEITKRSNSFKRQARQITSLYDPFSKNIDNLGGLLPTTALRLLSVAHLSPALSQDTRQKAEEAIKNIISSIQKGAIHDPLDNLYFYAQTGQDWNLPAFSKDLETQTQLANTLISCGLTIDDPQMINSGITILKNIEKEWLPHNYTNESSLVEPKTPGIFLWDWPTLEKVLSPEELTLAQITFGLKENGNIPIVSDPTALLYSLNSLSSDRTLSEIASSSSSSPEEIQARLNNVITKLKEHREKTGSIFRETQITAQSRAHLCLAQLTSWSATGSPIDLAAAVATGNIIRKDYHSQDQPLTRFPSSNQIKARGKDYAFSILAGINLYQATLDKEWFDWSTKLANEALELLTDDENDLLIAEISQKERITPIKIHSHSMIFSESTIGIFDHAITKITALSGNKKFQKTRTSIAKSLAVSSQKLPIIHTDFLLSCALGDEPLVAVLSGNPKDPHYQSLLKQLNQPQFISFLVLRSDQTESEFSKLPDFQTFSGNSGITLLRGSKVLGQAQEIAPFRSLLLTELSRKE